MKQKKLGDIATYVNGYAFKPEDRGTDGLPIIRIQDLTGNSYDLGFYNGEYPEKIEINNGDILISWSASLGIYEWNKGKALLNQHIFKVVFDKLNVNKKFFVFAVKYKLKEIEKKTHGATMKHITKKDFDNVIVPFPSLKEQQEIADTLDKLQSIITHRQKQLEKLDELIKARFVEMFGDPESNNYNWDTFKMAELCTVSSSKRVYQSELTNEGVPFLRISDLVNRMDYSTETCDLFISEEKYSDLLDNGLVPKKGDILVTARGTLGRCYIVKDTDRFYFQDGMITWLSGYSEKIIPVYISYLFSMQGIKKQIEEMQAGSTVAYLSIAMTKKLNIMLPPLGLQNQFADFVKQVDKSKVVIQKHLEKAQLLFDSLMQEYFG